MGEPVRRILPDARQSPLEWLRENQAQEAAAEADDEGVILELGGREEPSTG